MIVLYSGDLKKEKQSPAFKGCQVVEQSSALSLSLEGLSFESRSIMSIF